MARRLILFCTAGALLNVVIFWYSPINSGFLKLGLLISLVVAWLGLLGLLRKRKAARNALLLLPLGFMIPFSLPGRVIDPVELRENYGRRVAAYEGTSYFWGGESARGIDCSGLPRRALRDALLHYGWRHANGRAFRAFAEQWWFDASAKALGEGYRGYTIDLTREGTIREMDYGRLATGDLAVTTSGLHILVYTGDGKWIQADPGIGSVATLDGRKDSNEWFDLPVTLHRWQMLDGAK